MRSCAGNGRGGAGCTCTGGRQPDGGVPPCGGPTYRTSGRLGGGAGVAAPGSGVSPGGRRQKASSAESPLRVVTLSDATNRSRTRPSAGATRPERVRTGPSRRGYAFRVHSTDEPAALGASRNDDRRVDLTDDYRVLPDQSVDDTDRGWGELPRSNDDRLLAERPPHWD